MINFCTSEFSKVLGMFWSSNTDSLSFSIDQVPAERFVSKRTIFDPTGLLGPITVRAKIFLQQLWS